MVTSGEYAVTLAALHGPHAALPQVTGLITRKKITLF
jgi:hypothetical protein